jgi:hypothetical protein
MNAFLKPLSAISQVRNLTKLKLVLLISFSLLLLFQFLVGFRDFDDYLIVFIFVLFLNDLYLKISKPQSLIFQDERGSRLIMSGVFLVLLTLPFLFDSLNISNASRLLIYKLGFVLWAQIFLLDSFIHYKQTNSKQWLVFANMAALMIIIGAFVS